MAKQYTTILAPILTFLALNRTMLTLYETILAHSHWDTEKKKEERNRQELTCPQVVTSLGKDYNEMGILQRPSVPYLDLA